MGIEDADAKRGSVATLEDEGVGGRDAGGEFAAAEGGVTADGGEEGAGAVVEEAGDGHAERRVSKMRDKKMLIFGSGLL
jgi:hypothetical protein